MNLNVPQPPDALFTNSQEAPTLREKTKVNYIERIDCVQYKGSLVYYKGASQPKKGFPTPEAIHELNKIKRLILELSRNLNWLILLGILLCDKNKLINSFNIIFDKIFVTYNVRHHRIKHDFMCQSSATLATFISKILTDYGINEISANTFGVNIAQIIEYDDAYRYRAQDIATEININNLTDNPIKEIKRLLDLSQSREMGKIGITKKIRSIVMPVVYLLYIPKFRKIFIQNAYLLEGMKYDESDWYWVCRRDDYLFGGKTFEERSINNELLETIEIEG